MRCLEQREHGQELGVPQELAGFVGGERVAQEIAAFALVFLEGFLYLLEDLRELGFLFGVESQGGPLGEDTYDLRDVFEEVGVPDFLQEVPDAGVGHEFPVPYWVDAVERALLEEFIDHDLRYFGALASFQTGDEFLELW